MFLGPSLSGRNLVGLGSPIIEQEERRLSKDGGSKEERRKKKHEKLRKMINREKLEMWLSDCSV